MMGVVRHSLVPPVNTNNRSWPRFLSDRFGDPYAMGFHGQKIGVHQSVGSNQPAIQLASRNPIWAFVQIEMNPLKYQDIPG